MGDGLGWQRRMIGFAAMVALAGCDGVGPHTPQSDSPNSSGMDRPIDEGSKDKTRDQFNPELGILVKSCGEDIYEIEWKAKGSKKEIDGYCQGYLLGMYNSMKMGGEICPGDKDKLLSAHFLRSILQDYIKGRNVSGLSQSEVVWSAYKDAFSCK